MKQNPTRSYGLVAVLSAHVLAAGALLGTWSCQEEDAPMPPPRRSAERTPAPAPPAAAPKKEVKGPELSAIAARVAAHVAEASKARLPKIDALFTATGPARKAVMGMYAERKLRYYRLDGNLTEDGVGLTEVFGDLDRHGIDRRGYRLAALDAATQAVVEAFAAERRDILKVGRYADTARVALAIANWVRSGQGGEIALVRAGGDELDGAARKSLDEGLPALLKSAEEAHAALWKADVALSEAVVRYVVDMLWARPAHPQDFTTPATIRRMAESKADEIAERLRESRGRTAQTLRALWPSHPQYRKLLRAVDRYDALAASGGWKKMPRLPGKKVVRGARGAFVLALRERLAAEGYEVASEGDVLDEALEKAVIDFQARHHLSEDGVIGKAVVAELDVPVEQRARQLRLGLERLREGVSRDPKGSFYVFVNIAAQRMFLYEDGKVIRNHRVIVGKDNDDIDYSSQIKGKINRTRMFSATMTKVTLAPRWYPTQRVIDLELGPALAKDPDYFEKHGYVSEMKPDGSEQVYQASGKSNLLGVVKFQFPNKHSIYMHDTPGKALFKRAWRAYSHGCIRLEKPRQLAYHILGREKRGFTRKKINEIIAEKEEKLIMLKTRIPVYIDYVSARVDEQDQVVFESDIYAYDLAYFSGQLPVEEMEDYKPASLEGI